MIARTPPETSQTASSDANTSRPTEFCWKIVCTVSSIPANTPGSTRDWICGAMLEFQTFS